MDEAGAASQSVACAEVDAALIGAGEPVLTSNSGEVRAAAAPALSLRGARLYLAVTVTLAAAVAGVLLWLEMRRYSHFGAGAYDFGIFEQTVWLIAHGHQPFVTVRGMLTLGDHFSPILYLISALRHLIPTPYVLCVVQSLSLAAGAIPLYRLALRRSKQPWIACLLAASYLAHPSLWGMAAFDYHPETLAVPVLLAALDAIDGRKWGWLAFWCGLAIVCKESLPPVVFMLGLLAVLRGGRWHGGAIAAGAAAWFFIATGAMAHFAGRHSSAYLSLYSPVLNAARHGTGALFSTVCQMVSSPGSLGYLTGLMGPLAFLYLLAPEVALVAVPSLLSGVLSKVDAMHTIGYQYDVVPLAVLYAAAAVGMGRALNLAKREGVDPFHAETLLAVILLYSGMVSVTKTTWPSITHLYGAGVSSGLAAERDELLSKIPPGASVTAPSDILPHLADRQRIYMFPNPAQESCWGPSIAALEQQRGLSFTPCAPETFRAALAGSGVEYVVLVLDHGPRFPLTLHDYHQLAGSALTCPQFGVVETGGDLVLLRRGAAFQEGLKRLALDSEKSPDALDKELEQDWPALPIGDS